jgi:FlaG/FlaF family flagellin (archaellin)
VLSTLLLLAITVLLSAILFVMVIGFGPAKARPTLGLLPAERKSLTLWRIAVADVNLNEDLSNYKVMVFHGNNIVIGIKTVKNGTLGEYTHNDTGKLTMGFFDLTGNGRLGRGDYFTFTFSRTPETLNTFELSVLWANDDSKLISGSFVT